MSLRRAYLRQPRSDFAVFNRLLEWEGVEMCHWLHYLQMATETLAKAVRLEAGARPDLVYSHIAFSKLTSLLRANPGLADAMAMRRSGFAAWLDASASLRASIETLHPHVARDGPDVEYPFLRGGGAGETYVAPADYNFSIGNEIHGPNALRLRKFVMILLDQFDRLF